MPDPDHMEEVREMELRELRELIDYDAKRVEDFGRHTDEDINDILHEMCSDGGILSKRELAASTSVDSDTQKALDILKEQVKALDILKEQVKVLEAKLDKEIAKEVDKNVKEEIDPTENLGIEL